MQRKGAAKGKDILEVVRAGLCTGCGTCVAMCSRSAIALGLDHGGGVYIPLLDRGRCNECGICFEVCPGHSVDFKQLNRDIFGQDPEDTVLGTCRSCYLGHATDHDVRYNAASGGLVTALLCHALEEGLITGALVTRMNRDRPLEPEPFVARTREDIISACKSKYCPVAANTALTDILRAGDGERFAVVGLPCHIQGVRKAEKISRRLKERIVLHLALLCSHSDSFLETDFLLRRYGIDKDEVTEIEYRGRGWPGHMTIHTKGQKEKSIFYDDYTGFHQMGFFTPRRCTLCCDAIARLSDITLADAWLPEVRAQDSVGTSIAVCRTEAGMALLRSAQSTQHVALQGISSAEVLRSQGRARMSNKDLGANLALCRLSGKPTPMYGVDFARSGGVNYVRAIVTNFNLWVSSRVWLHRLIGPMCWAQRRVFERVRSSI